jgi:hypothetical protein
MDILQVLHQQSEDPKSLPNLEIEIAKMAGRNREASPANRRKFYRFTPPYMQIRYEFYQYSISKAKTPKSLPHLEIEISKMAGRNREVSLRNC